MSRIFVAQLALIGVLALVFWGVSGSVAGYSALLGGVICIIPNAFLALRLRLLGHDFGANDLVRAAYIGELGKFALTVALFSVVFMLVRPLKGGALFAAFIATQIMTLFGLLIHDRKTDA
tara:strand:+ start:125 stop:484 length:360 start_codon:yes stop_codon:yes gene_type:complete